MELDNQNISANALSGACSGSSVQLFGTSELDPGPHTLTVSNIAPGGNLTLVAVGRLRGNSAS